MSVTADQHWVYRFHSQILLTYQQMRGMLDGFLLPGMVHRDVRAAIDHHERMGLVIANDVVDPYGQNLILNPPSSKRAVTLQSSNATVMVADEDTLRSMADPQSAQTETIVGAIARRGDKHIIDALLGSAQIATVTSGSGIITYSTIALPSSQKLGGATAMDLIRIIAAHTKLSKASVPMGPAERKFLYTAGQEVDIMAITQASSSDFTKNQIHDRGTISGLSWQGFDWLCMADVVQIDGTTLQTMLPLISATERACIAFYRGAVGLSIGRPQGAPSVAVAHWLMGDPIQVKQKMMQAAVRVFEAAVVQVSALEN